MKEETPSVLCVFSALFSPFFPSFYALSFCVFPPSSFRSAAEASI
jgi:hypothetical protein